MRVGTTRYLSVIVNCVISCYVLFQYLYLSSSFNQILCIHRCWNFSTIHFSQGWVSIKYSINWKVSQSVAQLSGWQGDMQSEYNHNTNWVIFSHFSKQINTKKCQHVPHLCTVPLNWKDTLVFRKVPPLLSCYRTNLPEILDFLTSNLLTTDTAEKKKPHSNQCVKPSTGSVDQHMNTGIWAR